MFKSLKNIKYKFLAVFFLIFALPNTILAQANTPAFINEILTTGNLSRSLTVFLVLASVSFIPFFLICTTSFLRTVIVLSMIRTALQTQQAPPNVVLVALAMFLTVFVMTPTWQEVNLSAIKPYQEGRVNQIEMLELSVKPFRKFMLKQTRDKDLALFMEFSQIQNPQDYENIPTFVLIPAFIISELKTAFQIGFLLFIPFVVIDLIISNILLSLGMFMLSPAMVSLPFKILLFVLTDGWNLIIRGLILSFQ